MSITVRAERKGRKDIVATFETRAALESAVKGWLRYFRVTIIAD